MAQSKADSAELVTELGLKTLKLSLRVKAKGDKDLLRSEAFYGRKYRGHWGASCRTDQSLGECPACAFLRNVHLIVKKYQSDGEHHNAEESRPKEHLIFSWAYLPWLQTLQVQVPEQLLRHQSYKDEEEDCCYDEEVDHYVANDTAASALQ